VDILDETLEELLAFVRRFEVRDEVLRVRVDDERLLIGRRLLLSLLSVDVAWVLLGLLKNFDVETIH
jgi:hypothetical protein